MVTEGMSSFRSWVRRIAASQRCDFVASKRRALIATRRPTAESGACHGTKSTRGSVAATSDSSFLSTTNLARTAATERPPPIASPGPSRRAPSPPTSHTTPCAPLVAAAASGSFAPASSPSGSADGPASGNTAVAAGSSPRAGGAPGVDTAGVGGDEFGSSGDSSAAIEITFAESPTSADDRMFLGCFRRSDAFSFRNATRCVSSSSGQFGLSYPPSASASAAATRSSPLEADVLPPAIESSPPAAPPTAKCSSEGSPSTIRSSTVERHAPAPEGGGVVADASPPAGVGVVDSATHRETEKCRVRLDMSTWTPTLSPRLNFASPCPPFQSPSTFRVPSAAKKPYPPRLFPR
mmetsp:Transcript_17718/g.42776  ORF Transcript_17718/g.42776 Transcript_17718/m.42776 type:complete len:351 (+) Transcript_17718:1543-2595(+)